MIPISNVDPRRLCYHSSTVEIPPPQQAMLRSRLFSHLQVAADGRVLPFSAMPKTTPLLAYLILHRDRPIPRDHLAGLLWSDVGQGGAGAVGFGCFGGLAAAERPLTSEWGRPILVLGCRILRKTDPLLLR